MTPDESSFEETLKRLMRYAGIPDVEYETTTVRQLALRLQRNALIPRHCRCGHCFADYGFAEWIRLKCLRDTADEPAESRECRVCGAEIRMRVHA